MTYNQSENIHILSTSICLLVFSLLTLSCGLSIGILLTFIEITPVIVDLNKTI